MDQNLIALLDGWDDHDRPFDALMAVLGKSLDCDRCLLFLRQPSTGLSRMTHAWSRKPEFDLVRKDRGWQPESPNLVADDPMFAEALRNPNALYIDDIKTADPALVNEAFERENFGHRALIHAPIYHDHQMYGILEPCVFAVPRRWTDRDRNTVEFVQDKIAPLVARYVAQECG